MRKIYFACSIRSGREDQQMYIELIEAIKKHAVVLSEVFADGKLDGHGSRKPSPDIWKDDMAMVEQADAVIAEVTTPSLGVGYEIAKAEEMKKPILCLFRPQPDRSLSGMVDGSPYTKVITYRTTDEAIQAINLFLREV